MQWFEQLLTRSPVLPHQRIPGEYLCGNFLLRSCTAKTIAESSSSRSRITHGARNTGSREFKSASKPKPLNAWLDAKIGAVFMLLLAAIESAGRADPYAGLGSLPLDPKTDIESFPCFGGDAKEAASMTVKMNERLKIRRGSGNVFRDLGFGEQEAQNLLLRSELILWIEDFVRRSGLTQAAAAKRLRLTQPRLNAMLKGKIELFSLDALVNIATYAGLRVELKVKRAA
jgi:predicted XRE-type DNA-binding protein